MSAYLKQLLELAAKANAKKPDFGVQTAFVIALRHPDFLAYVAALEAFYEVHGAVALHDQSLSGASRRYERKSQATTSVESARQKLEVEGK